MKRFPTSTILGLTLGVFLAGYAVFAFQAPTSGPPGGNVAAPLNVGAGNQVKQGGLWVGSLGVDGAIKMGEFSSLPICNSKGTLVFNTTAGKPYICDGASWKEYRGDTGATGATGATGPQGPPGPTAPVSTGLYGKCTLDDNYSRNDYCDYQLPPASCINHYTPQAQCVCPGGYTVVNTGNEPDPYGVIRQYSCYKN